MNHLLKTITLILVFTTSSLQAHTGQDHQNLRHWEIASADPDRIFLSLNGDPATSRAVNWRTDTSVTHAYAEIGPALGEPNFSDFAQRIAATTETIDLNLSKVNTQGPVNYHSVNFTNLEPETLYAYRLGDGGDRWSEWIQFRTASREPKAFKFLYFGDAQNDVLSQWSRTIRMANQIAPDSSFALHAGDLINTAHTDVEWAGWFKAGGFLHSQWSGVPVTGNHEYRNLPGTGQDNVFSILWRPQFNLPIESVLPEKLHETVYTIEYQGLQLIVLNSNELIEEQTPYLEAHLKKPGYRWRIVSYHHPIFALRGKIFPTTKTMSKQWKPLFEKYNVDLVLQGHDHAYTRGQVPVRKDDGFEKDSFQTMYVTSVSGPKQYKIKHDYLESNSAEGLQTIRTGENTQFFQLIEIDGNKLSYQAFTTAGELYDAATLSKDFETGKKNITQQVPDSPTRTFDNTIEFSRPWKVAATAGSPAAATLKEINSSDSNTVLIAAHRGGYENDKADDAPENSVANVANSMARGIHLYESDISLTRDGRFVIIHDTTIDRETTGTGPVNDHSLAELKQLYKRFRDGSISTQRIATFQELIRAGKGKTIFKIDLKKGVNQHLGEIIDIIRAEDMMNGVIIRLPYSDRGLIKEYIASGGEYNRNLFMFKLKTEASVDEIISLCDPRMIQVDLDRKDPTNQISIKLIKYATAKGLLVETHAYQSPEEWDVLIDAGVRMLHTKQVSEMKALIESRRIKADSGLTKLEQTDKGTKTQSPD